MYTFFTITAKQISILQGTSYETARKEWHRLRSQLNLATNEPLRLRHVAIAWGASVEDLARILYSFKGK